MPWPKQKPKQSHIAQWGQIVVAVVLLLLLGVNRMMPSDWQLPTFKGLDRLREDHGRIDIVPISDDEFEQALQAQGLDIEAVSYEVRTCGGLMGRYDMQMVDRRDDTTVNVSLPVKATWRDPEASSIGIECPQPMMAHMVLDAATLEPNAKLPTIRSAKNSASVDPAQAILLDLRPYSQSRYREVLKLLIGNTERRCSAVPANAGEMAYRCTKGHSAAWFSGVLMANLTASRDLRADEAGAWIAGCSEGDQRYPASCDMWFWHRNALIKAVIPLTRMEDPAATRAALAGIVDRWIN